MTSAQKQCLVTKYS